MKYAGEAWEDKVDRLRKDLVENKYFGMIVTELDEIAWLFNIRGVGIWSIEHIKLLKNAVR